MNITPKISILMNENADIKSDLQCYCRRNYDISAVRLFRVTLSDVARIYIYAIIVCVCVYIYTYIYTHNNGIKKCIRV